MKCVITTCVVLPPQFAPYAGGTGTDVAQCRARPGDAEETILLLCAVLPPQFDRGEMREAFKEEQTRLAEAY